MGELTVAIEGRLIAFDSAPLIYYLEEHPTYIAIADELFDAIDRGSARGITSVLTLLEVLVAPVRTGRHDLAKAFRELLTHAANITIHPIDEAVCEQAVRLRAKYSWLRTPDALQIATAIEYHAEVVVTNDDRWKSLAEMRVVVLKDYLSAHK